MASDSAEQQVVVVENVEKVEVSVQVVKRSGVFTGVLYYVSRFWPISIMIRAYRGFWYMFGFRPKSTPEVPILGSTPARPSRQGLKRLRRITRIIMAVLPRRMQSALGYPVPASVGCSLSPEMRISPTKPCGKGNKRKQDELDEDEDEEGDELEQHTWVEAFANELATDEGSEEDPDYEPSAVETESDEYSSRNESDTEEVDKQGLVIIEELAIPPADVSLPAL
ncbi:oogenesis-related isoform X1 [Gadus macrocephalus]|uniref:oogenesis-related isoform X1 n=1 Tax=Gadus macrocephalus TaxID=80720 RepID=UPI0028CBB07E|nr:oogenesis-related isoform X1 [Gadus macrocephalus]